MYVALLRLMVEGKKCTNISQIIGGANDMNALPNESFGEMCLGARRAGQHHNINVERIIKRPRIDGGTITKTLSDEFNATATFIAKHHIVVIG